MAVAYGEKIPDNHSITNTVSILVAFPTEIGSLRLNFHDNVSLTVSVTQ